MPDIYISEDGDATVDLMAFSARYEKRIAELEAEAVEWSADCESMALKVVTLQAQLADAQKDAERLQWALQYPTAFCRAAMPKNYPSVSDDEQRRSIDAARGEDRSAK